VQNQYGCRTGFVTLYTCGFVTSTSLTVSYGATTVTNLIQVVSACANSGDSGGAFIDGNTALGILSGQSPTNPCYSYYAHVWDIGYWLGVWVKTS
jgi:hypothetical protein